MLWVIYSIIAVLIWAVVNTVDKYVLEKRINNSVIPVAVFGIVGLFVAAIIYLTQGFQSLSVQNIKLALIAGIFLKLTNVFYFKAIKIEEISRVVPLLSLSPLFVLILATIFLGEVFQLLQYLGIFLLVIGAILISIKNFKEKITITKAFLYMMVVNLFCAVGAIIVKYLLGYANFWTIFAYTRIGAIFVLVPIFYLNYPEFISVAKKQSKVIGLIFLNKSFSIIGTILVTAAMAVGYVTLVRALVSTKSFFILLLAVIISIYCSKILKEDIRKSVIITKLIAITLMFAGVILII